MGTGQTLGAVPADPTPPGLPWMSGYPGDLATRAPFSALCA